MRADIECVIGFTGTHHGMNSKQKTELKKLLQDFKPVRFLHGCCMGADDQADLIAWEMGIPRVLFPATKLSMVGNCMARGVNGKDWSLGLAFPTPYPLQRNKLIVDNSTYLLAAPQQTSEILRSGTWSTVRYARKAGVPAFMLYHV